MTDCAEPSDVDALAIAVLVPCFNEEESIGQVVRQFAEALPQAVIYVYDNDSTDRTSERALAAGAIVRHELRRGKGNVVRRMFADVAADVYVLVDGDGTYDAASAPAMVETLISHQLDMVVAARTGVTRTSYPRGHQFGNRFFTWIIARVFGEHTRDVLSGYRVFSRRFVRSFPAFS
jgi:glycosyltransferase involved in cell wall biosynthesis